MLIKQPWIILVSWARFNTAYNVLDYDLEGARLVFQMIFSLCMLTDDSTTLLPGRQGNRIITYTNHTNQPKPGNTIHTRHNEAKRCAYFMGYAVHCIKYRLLVALRATQFLLRVGTYMIVSTLKTKAIRWKSDHVYKVVSKIYNCSVYAWLRWYSVNNAIAVENPNALCFCKEEAAVAVIDGWALQLTDLGGGNYLTTP